MKNISNEFLWVRKFANITKSTGCGTKIKLTPLPQKFPPPKMIQNANFSASLTLVLYSDQNKTIINFCTTGIY